MGNCFSSSADKHSAPAAGGAGAGAGAGTNGNGAAAVGNGDLELKSIVPGSPTPTTTTTTSPDTATITTTATNGNHHHAPATTTTTTTVTSPQMPVTTNTASRPSTSSSSSASTASTSTSDRPVESGRRTTLINQMLREDERQQRAQIKLLLLGSGECGKSTILKQMKILHRDGFTHEERAAAAHTIYYNLLSSLQNLVRACEILQIPYRSIEARSAAAHIMSLSVLAPSTTEHLPLVTTLWNDEGIRAAFDRRSEFYLLDSAPYFLEHAARLLTPDYVPTDQDILRSRHATTGIIEAEFIVNRNVFKMYDVGGQRGERKKWIHCFDSVDAILFVSSLNDYDQVLEEDRTRNRLVESLVLFEGIISLPWFRHAAIILFLNKDDLFREKVARVDIGAYFPGYVGGLDYEEGLDFIKEMFFAKNNNPSRTIYAHVTDATDTSQFAFVWQAIRSTIIEANLRNNDLR